MLVGGGAVKVRTGFWGEVDTESSDGVLSRVPVQLSHQQVVVLHPQRKLLHICPTNQTQPY